MFYTWSWNSHLPRHYRLPALLSRPTLKFSKLNVNDGGWGFLYAIKYGNFEKNDLNSYLEYNTHYAVCQLLILFKHRKAAERNQMWGSRNKKERPSWKQGSLFLEGSFFFSLSMQVQSCPFVGGWWLNSFEYYYPSVISIFILHKQEENPPPHLIFA